jgi:hypothetical protein
VQSDISDANPSDNADNANIANISCALTETSELLDTMQSLHPQTGGGAGQTLLELAAVIAVALLNFPDRSHLEPRHSI